MSCLDEALVASGIPMLNSPDCRRRCENKILAHQAFAEHGIVQPKPLYGNRSAGIEICGSFAEALERARERREDLLLQQMIWPARCWRIAVGRAAGLVDPYWREPRNDGDRVLSISTGSRIARGRAREAVSLVAMAMLEAVDGDLLAVDILETEDAVYALEINHNFDAHGGGAPSADAFYREIRRTVAAAIA